MKAFCLTLFVIFCVAESNRASALSWKPILGQSTALTGLDLDSSDELSSGSSSSSSSSLSSSHTSAFSLEQTHPDYGANEAITTNHFNLDNANADLFVKQQQQQQQQPQGVSTLTSASSSYQASIIQPSSINFNDAQFGYKPFDYAADHCAVKKYAFNNDGLVQYDNKIPELKQFTICFWMRFTNHSGDHVILTYSVKDEPRAIQFWVANSNSSSFISMAIKGQQMYRLNYPLRVKQWHHTCTSWNGKTGEWQVWLKAERIGRGFHNSLVGYKIPGGGKLYSGGTSTTGKITEGLHFEVTLMQMYRVALSAGKAHRDHKHHHVHHFDHEGRVIQTTTRPPPIINRPLPMHSLLANGQIPTRVRLNLAQPVQDPLQLMSQIQKLQQQQLQQPNLLTIQSNFINGQLNSGSRLVAQQLIGLNHNYNQQLQLQPQLQTQLQLQPQPQPLQQLQPQSQSQSQQQQQIQQSQFNIFYNPSDELTHTQNVQFIDESETRIHFKRHIPSDSEEETKEIIKRSTDLVNESKDKNIIKRDLVLLEDSRLLNDPLLIDNHNLKFDGLAEFGDQQFKNHLDGKYQISSARIVNDEVAEHDHEDAEDEVRAVMALCSLCDVEPFEGAIVFAWKDAHEQLDNVLQGYSVGGCGDF